MSLFENFASPRTWLDVGREREHPQDMLKIKHVEDMVLGQEVISCFYKNETLHRENCGLQDKFNRVSDLAKPYVPLSGGVSSNV